MAYILDSPNGLNAWEGVGKLCVLLLYPAHIPPKYL